MSESITVTGNIHLCFTCHQPIVFHNGELATPPGGVTVWKDRSGTTRITPHAEGCEGPHIDPVLKNLI